MVYRGHVKRGVIVLENGARLPEGARVSVRPLKGRSEAVKRVSPHDSRPAQTVKKSIPSLYERLKPIIGKARGLPADFAENHDHYLYGVPKRRK